MLSLVPLCPQSFFRQVVFTSRSGFKDPLCFRRHRKQARLGGAPPPQPRPVCGWMGHSRLVGEGGALSPRRDVECPHSPDKKGRSRCTARRDSASVPPSQAVPAADRWRVRPRLDASAGVALRRRVFKKRNGAALVFLVSQLAFSNIEHRPLLIYTDYHTFRVLKMILGFKN